MPLLLLLSLVPASSPAGLAAALSLPVRSLVGPVAALASVVTGGWVPWAARLPAVGLEAAMGAVRRTSALAMTVGLRVSPTPATTPTTAVSLSPTKSALLGGKTLQVLINGLGWWALMAALVGLLIGAASWALGSHTQNYHQTFVGRKAVLISGLAALLIGGSAKLINFFWNTGVGLS